MIIENAQLIGKSHFKNDRTEMDFIYFAYKNQFTEGTACISLALFANSPFKAADLVIDKKYRVVTYKGSNGSQNVADIQPV